MRSARLRDAPRPCYTSAMPSLAQNRDALHDYTILETLEAGIALSGSEVKSVKLGNTSLKGAHAVISHSELWLLNMHIGHYKPAGQTKKIEADRSRKLLVRRTELDRLIGKLKSEGLALIPLSIYLKHGLIKVELGLGRGKKKYDKRASIKKRDTERRIGRAMRVKG